MNRRRFLGTITGALTLAAGCIESPSPTQYNTTAFDASSTPGPKPTESTLQRIVTLEDQDTVPEAHEIEITVEMLEMEITDDHTARLRMTTTNAGPPRGITISSGGCALFNRWDGQSDDPPGLWLYESEQAESVTRSGDRWTPESRDPYRFPDYGCTYHDYESGDSVTTEYVVWDNADAFGYLYPTTYRYEQPVRVAPIASERENHEATAEFVWGFDLRVEEP